MWSNLVPQIHSCCPAILTKEVLVLLILDASLHNSTKLCLCGETNFRSNFRINHLQQDSHQQWLPALACQQIHCQCQRLRIDKKYVIANQVSHDCQTLFHFAFSPWYLTRSIVWVIACRKAISQSFKFHSSKHVKTKEGNGRKCSSQNSFKGHRFGQKQTNIVGPKFQHTYLSPHKS